MSLVPSLDSVCELFESNFILPTLCCTLSADIWFGHDGFHYLYGQTTPQTSGDLSIEMFVESLSGSSLHQWAKGGLMIREDLYTGSKYFGLFVTGNNGLQNQWRPETWGDTEKDNKKNLPDSNVWLKITKNGNKFKAFYKTNANTGWTQVGSSQTIVFHNNHNKLFYYGIAVTSTDTSKTAKITCSNWSTSGNSPSVAVRFPLFHLDSDSIPSHIFYLAHLCPLISLQIEGNEQNKMGPQLPLLPVSAFIILYISICSPIDVNDILWPDTIILPQRRQPI